MAIVQRWTGRDAKLLRVALRLSVRDFATALGVGARTVSKWEGHAEAHTLGAIDSRGGAYARSRILDQIRLGKVRLAQQEPAEAADIGLRALAQAGTMRSSVVVKWFTGLATPLADRYGDVRAVGELKAAVAAFQPAMGEMRPDV